MMRGTSVAFPRFPAGVIVGMEDVVVDAAVKLECVEVAGDVGLTVVVVEVVEKLVE